MNCNTQLFISLWMLLQKIHYHSFALVNRASFKWTKITCCMTKTIFISWFGLYYCFMLSLGKLIYLWNRSCWFFTTKIKSRQREKAQQEQKKRTDFCKNIFLNTHTFQNAKMFKDCSCIVWLLCWNDLIPFIRSLYSMLHFTLWIHMYLCNISWIIIIVVRETFTTQSLKCWEENNSTNDPNVNLLYFYWIHTLWMRHDKCFVFAMY